MHKNVGKIRRAQMTISGLEGLEITDGSEEERSQLAEVSRLKAAIKRWQKEMGPDASTPPDFSALASVLGASVAPPADTVFPVESVLVGEHGSLDSYWSKAGALLKAHDLTQYSDQAAYLAGLSAIIGQATELFLRSVVLRHRIPGADGAEVIDTVVTSLLDKPKPEVKSESESEVESD